MTGLPLIPGLALAVVLGIATLVGARLLARRAAMPVEGRVVGAVPPVSEWLPDALKGCAAESAGSSVHFSDLMDGQILRGHLARVSLPSESVEFDVRTQPHLVLAERPASHPLVIMIDLVEAPRRTGVSRLAYGPTPTAAALEARSRLQKAVARAARDRGLTVQAPRPAGGRALILAGALLIVLVLLATALGALVRWQSEPTGDASPTASPTPWFPVVATECPAPTTAADKPPTRTAVAKGTSCAFAKTVRTAFLKSGGSGSTVKLGKLRYDKLTKVGVTCTRGQPIVCRGGTKVVYLS